MDLLKSTKLGLDNKPPLCYNKGTKEKEITTMKYFELKNTKTQATTQVVAKNLMDAYKQVGWRPQDGRLIWKADADAVNGKGEY